MPFGADLITAIAQQETGYIWAGLVQRGLSEKEGLRLCVGDTLDADKGCSCFPKEKSELLGARRGSEMFALTRKTLLDGALRERLPVGPDQSEQVLPRLRDFPVRHPILSRDSGFFPAAIVGDFEACLAQLLDGLKAAMARQGWAQSCFVN